MKFNKKSQFFERYIRIIPVIYALIFLFRLFETASIIYSYGFSNEVVFSEFIGFCFDMLGAGIFIIGYAFLFFPLSKLPVAIIRLVNIGLLFILTVVYFLIIKYFLYQLIPLDVFLYKYTIAEIMFTINTGNTNYVAALAGLAVILIITLGIARVLDKIKFKPLVIKLVFSFVLVSIPLFYSANYLVRNWDNKYSMNKPIYFISESIKHLVNNTQNDESNIAEFRNLYPDKNFIEKEYPLVYNIERDDNPGEYFNKFEGSPNIVLLIIEGLNDDFIHPYKGASLMPFLTELKNKSLYWKHCFTLGERSFAAVPSILGGLPYGDNGFTLQERLPRHLSLVSVLNSNDYFTTFYYGQGAWFHKKDRFFAHNDMDLIFDKSKFSENYNKIVVGDDQFFWGYNDKDLFSQSLKVIDTLNQNRRFDIYFTGTSHSPYIISNDDLYNNKLQAITSEQNKAFFTTYGKYLKSVLYVDDALKDFFNEYKKRSNYENTVFIITGDHPMTEVPIDNSLKRYHVPLIIYSEKLKENHTFSHTVSHLDISESILSLLQNYIEHIPSISTSLGYQLFSKENAAVKSLAFMNDNREVIDFLYGNYYLSKNKLYYVDSVLNINEIENDSIELLLSKKLTAFNNTSRLVTRNNTIISSSLYCKALEYLNIYEKLQKESVQTSSEYINLTDNVLIPNIDFIFDMSVYISANKKDEISIVYQITNSKDSTLFWRNFGINEAKLIQENISVGKINSTDTTLYFKSYIWNKNNYNLTLSDLNILLYSAKPMMQKK